jgi:hypothetical protein
MAAADGQTLSGQSAETQAAFQAIHGGNAEQAWTAEHNAAIGANNAPAASPGTAPSSLPSTAPQSAGGQQTYPGVSSNDLSAIRAGLQASSGLSIKQLDEQMREFDAQLDWQKQMWAQQGLPQLAIQQRAADLEQKKFEQLTAQVARQQDFTEEIGRRQAALAEKAQTDANAIAQGQLGVSQGQLGLGQSQLGLDTLKTAASLTGPESWVRAANYARGVAQTNLPEFINRLLTGQSTNVLGGPAPGATMSAPNTLTGLANTLTAGGQVAGGTTVPNRFTMDMPTAGAAPMQAGVGAIGSMGSDVGYAANRLRALYAMGGQALAPGALEGLSPTEKSMFEGGGSDIGADVSGFENAYARSRIGQSAANPGVAA